MAIGLDAQTMLTILGFATVALAIAMLRLPVGTCPECGHCRLARLERERAAQRRASRIYGIPFCESCGRIHSPDDDHPG